MAGGLGSAARTALLLLAAALSLGASAQQDPDGALPNAVVTARLAGRSIAGLVTHQPGALQVKRAIALFPGHPGIMRLRAEDGRIKYELRGNFLVRSRGFWLDDETLTVTIDAPDDQWGSFTQRFRATARYGEDVAGLLDAVDAKYGRLEWSFVGTSEGSISAFHAARMLAGTGGPRHSHLLRVPSRAQRPRPRGCGLGCAEEAALVGAPHR